MSFPLPEAVAVRVLKAAGMASATAAPQMIPSGFVRVQAVGGSKRSIALSQRLVQLHCYGGTQIDAARTAEQAVSTLVGARFTTPELRDVTVTGEPSYFPDPDTELPRYSAVVAFQLRAN